MFMFTVILVFNGFEAFIGSFSIAGFFASYITIPVVILSFLGFKFYLIRQGAPTGLKNLEDIDLSGGPERALQGTRYESGWTGISQ